MKKSILFGIGICSLFAASTMTKLNQNLSPLKARTTVEVPKLELPPAAAIPAANKKIKLALILDTSGSMDGLLDQAKSQLWTIVNEMGKATIQRENPDLEIALYQYGNDGLSPKGGFIRQEVGFTHDLDRISEKLFALSTNGGDEYCGQAIYRSLNELEWGKERVGYKAVFIAGNESFDQGGVDKKVAFGLADEMDVFVNTIYCGPEAAGVSEGWNAALNSGLGTFVNIDSDKQTVYVSTPYDNQISDLNASLNDTYVWYGTSGKGNYDNMIVQDNNANTYGLGNSVNRAMSKNSGLYQNRNYSWDLVDRLNTETDFKVSTIPNKNLPENMRKMSNAQKQNYVISKSKERARINQQIATLGKLRDTYIAGEKAKQGIDASLENAMIGAIQKQAGSKGFSFADQIGSVEPEFVPALVDMDFFMETAKKVQKDRKNRAVNFNQFLQMASEPNTIILDARGKEHYDAMHIQGAIHLDFAAFNAYDLARIIPNPNTRILIYCNNNIDTDSPDGFRGIRSEEVKLEIQRNLVTKGRPMPRPENVRIAKAKKYQGLELDPARTLALNIPTFINLYGYGYTNVYELSELVKPNDPRLVLEGNSIPAVGMR